MGSDINVIVYPISTNGAANASLNQAGSGIKLFLDLRVVVGGVLPAVQRLLRPMYGL